MNKFNRLQNIYELKGGFFPCFVTKCRFGNRVQYIRDICALEHFFFYWKLVELKECKQAWVGSSAGA